MRTPQFPKDVHLYEDAVRKSGLVWHLLTLAPEQKQ